MRRKRLLRVTTVPISLHLLLGGQLKFMAEHGFEVLTASAKGDEVSKITTLGIQHQTVHLTRNITPLRDIIGIFQLIWVIIRFKPDIVHTHTPKAGMTGMIAAWICRVPHRIHTVAGLPLMESTGLKKQILILIEKLTYLLATAVYPNSSGLRDYILSTISRSKKIRVLGHGSTNGIDSDYFRRTGALEVEAAAIRTKYKIANNELVFSFVGRLVRDKGIAELLEAFHRIEREIPARLLLVGDFERDGTIGGDQRKMIVGNRQIIHAGFQDDIRPWLVASDVFVFPSYREGFPNAVMQAACLEIPCIVSDINGCNEIIRDQTNGLVIPEKNADALYYAMKRLANDKQERKRFAENARSYVVANFDQKFVWNELLKAYNLEC